jgi:hypothetical protein
MDSTAAFREEALKKYPNWFKEQGEDLLHKYKNGWRRVKPLSDCHAKIEGFPAAVIISASGIKRMPIAE